MSRINDFFTTLQAKAYCKMCKFLEDEQGDANFVSMLLIIGIVVVLAGLFLTLGKGVMKSISDKVNDFIGSL